MGEEVPAIVNVPVDLLRRGVFKPFTDEDMARFFTKIDELYCEDRPIAEYAKSKAIIYKALLVFLFRTGARISEVVTIKDSKSKDIKKGFGVYYENIRFSNDQMIVTLRSEKKRTPTYRRVFVPTENDPYLSVFLQYYNTKKEGDILFAMDRIKAWRKLKEVALALGYDEDKFWLHYLRGSSLTRDVMNGANPFVIKNKAGWSSIGMADRYISEEENMQRQYAEAMNKKRREEKAEGSQPPQEPPKPDLISVEKPVEKPIEKKPLEDDDWW